MSERDYTNEAQQRILKLVFALAGSEFQGLSNKELAALVGTSPSNIVRDLFNATKGGFAEQIVGTQRYRLGPRPVQCYAAFVGEMQRVREKTAEIEQRYTCLPG